MSKTLSQLRICAEKHLPEDKSVIKSLNDNGVGHLKAAFLKSKIWPEGSTINIQFNTEPTNIQWTSMETLISTNTQLDILEPEVRLLPNKKEAIKIIIEKRIKPLVNKLNINFVETGGNVKIGFDTDAGCWSLIGTDHQKSTDKDTMNFGWLDVGTVIHEFGHMLGLIHEHQNSLGQSIDWNTKLVYQWALTVQGWDEKTTYENILKKYEKNQLNGSFFDPHSIMLYFFPAELTNDNKGTNANYRLSLYDIEYILKIYNREYDKRVCDFVLQFYNELDPDMQKQIDTDPEKGPKKLQCNARFKPFTDPQITHYILISVIIILLVILISFFIFKK